MRVFVNEAAGCGSSVAAAPSLADNPHVSAPPPLLLLLLLLAAVA